MSVQKPTPDAASDLPSTAQPSKSGGGTTPEELLAVLQQALKVHKKRDVTSGLLNASLGEALAHALSVHQGGRAEKRSDPVALLQHDLRGPLNVLRLLVESMNHAPDGVTPEHLEMLDRNVRRLAGLVDELPRRFP